MKKKIIISLLILAALSSILFINMGNKSTADECKDCNSQKPIAVPTPPGNADFTKINCNCTGAIPTIKASATTIASGGSITLWVDSGGKACPDFTWSVSSAKYTLNKSKTTNDLETVTMTAASGTCSSGYNTGNVNITVTATDRCGKNSKIILRNTTAGWIGAMSSGIGGCSYDPNVYVHEYWSEQNYSFRVRAWCCTSGNIYIRLPTTINTYIGGNPVNNVTVPSVNSCTNPGRVCTYAVQYWGCP
jgi:hypothetical protein